MFPFLLLSAGTDFRRQKFSNIKSHQQLHVSCTSGKNSVLHAEFDSFPHEVEFPFLQIICEPRTKQKLLMQKHCYLSTSIYHFLL